MESLKGREGAVEEYDRDFMKRTLRQVTVYHDDRAIFEFFDGSEITVSI